MVHYTPKTAMLCYCACEPPSEDMYNVNRFVASGCSGILASEAEVSDGAFTFEHVITQMLSSIDLERSVHPIEKENAYANERFSGLSLTILSDSEQLTTLASRLGCSHVQLQQSSTAKQLLCQILQSTTSANVVFVDFTCLEKDAWHILDDLCLDSQLLHNTLLYIISPPSIQTRSSHDQNNSSNGQQWWSSIVPKQSYTKKNGIYLTGQGTTLQRDALVYTCFHMGSTRKDSVTTYHPKTMLQNGSERSILACHLMAEICYKLGLAGKYGA